MEVICLQHHLIEYLEKYNFLKIANANSIFAYMKSIMQLSHWHFLADMKKSELERLVHCHLARVQSSTCTTYQKCLSEIIIAVLTPKSGKKNDTGVTLNLSSNLIQDSNSETNFPHKLSLTDLKAS